MLLWGAIALASCFPGLLSADQCNVDDDQCEFWLDVGHRLTMMHGHDAVYAKNGRLYRYDVPEDQTNVTEALDPDMVVVADGWETQKLVTVVNGTMPGPSIEVYEGQTVVVHVTNHLSTTSVTLHWHGMLQRDTPWMDGVAFVTQCPVEPNQSFTYRFKAYPRGTFWYHSHLGTQRVMGLFGALIVREKKPLQMPEHIMVLQDWNHDWDAYNGHMRAEYGSFVNRTKVLTTDSLDTAHFSNILFQSGLINGRGRYLQHPSSASETPLTVFRVDEGNAYRFRVISAGNLYPYRVSVDGHVMSLIASDGFDIRPVALESFVINPGERFDFVITANQTAGNYWVRAITLEIDVVHHIALAILRYNASSMDDPTTDRKTCTQNDTCLVANCPFLYYPMGDNTNCLTFEYLKAAENHRTPGATAALKEEMAPDVFLNFGFPGVTSFPGSVNGIEYKVPPSPALTQPRDIHDYCPNGYACDDQTQCYCTPSLSLTHNTAYQMVFTNMGAGKGWSHPVHMHGHSFHVVKMGYPPYNKTTGELMGLDNPDVTCLDGPTHAQSFCNRASWTNASWGGNQVPGLELDTPPLKDTIIVPTGGYVVIRIRADNPGVWFMHCHIELHTSQGMATMLNESFGRQPKPPPGFPRCGNFLYDQASIGTVTGGDDDDDDDGSCIEITIFWPVVGCLILLCLVLIIVATWLWHTRSMRGSSSYEIDSGPNPVTHDNPVFTIDQ